MEYATIGTVGLQQVPAPVTSEDRVAVSRLTGLLDYVEALVKLDERGERRYNCSTARNFSARRTTCL
jgi:hypothetical protein